VIEVVPGGTVIEVVVVDDDFRIVELHSAAVQEVCGFHVIASANTAKAGAEAVRRHRPDLLLLDLYLPDDSGLNLLQQLRGDGIPIDVIVLTAGDEMAQVREALRLGAMQYLIKPFPLERLRKHLVEYQRVQRHLRWAPASQALVDRTFQLMRAGGDLEEPTERNPTVHRILQGLPRTGDWTSAADIAERVGVSPSTIRRYLSRLVDTGKVQLSLQYGVAGRPANLYRRARRSDVTAASADGGPGSPLKEAAR
jgi:two-component system CitB family response regulator